MQHTRGRHRTSFLVGLSVAAAAALATSAAAGASAPPDTGGAAGAAPTCEGEGDGVLTVGSVLPETGNLAFLGPPMLAAGQLAANEINEAGGVLGQELVYLPGDSGDTSTDIANQTVDRHLAAGVDVFLGAASSGVTFTFIDKVVENCKILFSPANTAPDFTTFPDDGLYFRTAPSDVLQGRVLADLMISDGITGASFMALQDPYGDGLIEFASTAFADQGGEVIDAFSYDPNAASFDAEVDRVVSADPEALVLIGFEESAQILTGLLEAGFTPESGKRVYFVDGNIGNALGAGLPPGSLEGWSGTTPAAELTEDFRAAMLEVDPELIDINYGPETYDAVVISALAAAIAGSDNPALVAAEINGVTRDGTKCTAYAECLELVEAGEDIDYDGPSGPQTFGPAGEPSEASFAIHTFDANNEIAAGIPTVFQFATL